MRRARCNKRIRVRGMQSLSSGLEQSDRNGSREADHAPSGVHQVQKECRLAA
jgi:hypothetical protein